MANRTMKLFGRAVATSGNVSLVVNFNNTEVHNGTVTTETVASIPSMHNSLHTEDGDLVELLSFDIDSTTDGDIPVSIAVTGGSLFWGYFAANYCPQDGVWDGSSYDGEGDRVLTPANDPATTFEDPNTNSNNSDGKINVQIDGATPPDAMPSDLGYVPGEWVYHIADGSTLTCSYTVDRGTN